MRRLLEAPTTSVLGQRGFNSLEIARLEYRRLDLSLAGKKWSASQHCAIADLLTTRQLRVDQGKSSRPNPPVPYKNPFTCSSTASRVLISPNFIAASMIRNGATSVMR